MFGQFYAGMRWTELPVAALLLFLAVFVAVVVRICRARRDEVDAIARLPLEGDHAGAGARRRS
jgi:cytochrome c oxidase cbb3-type subunit 4